MTLKRVLYGRYRPPEAKVAESDISLLIRLVPNSSGEFMIFDLRGEYGSTPLRDRLLSFHAPAKPDVIMFRGASDALLEELQMPFGRELVEESFGNASTFYVHSSGELHALSAIPNQLSPQMAQEYVTVCREAELAAMLRWAEAVWHDSAYHFIAPSGHHADRFIRIGDLFADPIDISRVADWCIPRIHTPVALLADTYQLIPLLQEIQLRLDRGDNTIVRKFIVPAYGLAAADVQGRLAEVIPWAREANARIVCVVSVSSTGGYIRQITEALKGFRNAPPIEFLVVCHANLQPDPSALCNVPVRHYPSASECVLCREGASHPIEIDQLRFSTKLGTRLLDLPKATAMMDQAPLIIAADEADAFRLHVHRPDRHGHLEVYIDTGKLLTSRVFRAKATLELAKLRLGFTPDLTLVPEHEHSQAIANWLQEEEIGQTLVINPRSSRSEEEIKTIQQARCILLVDDCVITGQTLLSTLESIQRAKEAAGEREYRLRAFVLVARPADEETWKGLGRRFFINQQRSLFAAWELSLRDTGFGSTLTCPWCVELRVLEELASVDTYRDLIYLRERIARLSDPNGLKHHIYLASEREEDRGWETAVRTSPHSYLGNVTDVAAYVACTSLLQKIRSEWNQNIERWSQSYAIALHTALRQFTDPVIAAAFLRAVHPQEVRSMTVASGLRNVLGTLNHDEQHPVLVAEILLARWLKKIPGDINPAMFELLVDQLPPPQQELVRILMR